MKSLLFSCGLLLALATARADIKLPAIFSDHLVLAQSAKVPLWGKADPGEEVSVTLNSQSAKATAAPDGRWRVELNLANSAPGPFTITVQGKNKLTISDVLVGQVWVAGGQSNMEFPLVSAIDGAQEMAASANPQIRVFQITKASAKEPADDCEGSWLVSSPGTSGNFTAVGYFFAKTLQAELKTPVGLIQNAFAGSPLEAWISAPALDSDPDLHEARERLTKADTDYPEQLKKFVETFPSWTADHAREDRPTADIAAFAAPDAPTADWASVTLHGILKATGLPKAGVFWVRKDVDVPASAVGKELPLSLGSFDAFDSVYWDGKLITGTPYNEYPGTSFQHRRKGYKIRSADVAAGRHTLAIRLYAPLGQPTFGGTPSVGGVALKGPWLAKSEFEFPELDAATLASAPKLPSSAPSTLPGYLFNAMVNPILTYAINGVIWYQGETNIGRGWQYRTAFPLMITDWRAQWKQGDFPFYFCQIPSYQEKKPTPEPSLWAELREAQACALTLPATGMATLIDLGEANDIHPRNKRPAGERLAHIVLARDHAKAIPFSGPLLESSKVEGDKIRLTFTHTDGGLVAQPLPATYPLKTSANETAPLERHSPNSQLEGFAICGADGKWFWADAQIENNTVLVSSPQVPSPVFVRYAWADNPTCNLYNAAGLPTPPFRTDDQPSATKTLKL
ncbi:sialate O-acetylesterase [soil metagenome]